MKTKFYEFINEDFIKKINDLPEDLYRPLISKLIEKVKEYTEEKLGYKTPYIYVTLKSGERIEIQVGKYDGFMLYIYNNLKISVKGFNRPLSYQLHGTGYLSGTHKLEETPKIIEDIEEFKKFMYNDTELKKLLIDYSNRYETPRKYSDPDVSIEV